MNRRYATDRGFTLVEVLIAVFVLALGLLGLCGLQVASLQNNHSAYLRSQATLLAYDMADRMRANATALAAPALAYNNPTATNNTNCTTVTGCTPAEMALHDMYEWSAAGSPTSVTNVLPSGAGIVCIDATPNDGGSAAPACDGNGNSYAIKVWWTDDRSGQEMRFVTTVSF
ncbi:MAG: type IV pilus modification protein PilV [Methylococcaceae bacterium]|nr:type IV pilus modification protein PilV [Methylococcaceae bacterium]